MDRVLIEVPSDHPGEQVARLEAVRDAQLRGIQEHRAAASELRATHAASRRWWQILKWMQQRDELRAFLMRAPRLDPAFGDQHARWSAGIGGEDRITAALRALSDDWQLFRGYKNRRGEIDHLLVGPGGVWAIEVKTKSVRVHIDGDAWSFEKFDKYGNLVDTGVLTDRGGRSWGRQVSDSARELETFLSSRGQAAKVHTAVVLVHERGELGSCANLTIDFFVVGARGLVEMLLRCQAQLEPTARDAVARLIRRDHEFNARKRARGRPRG